jgi:hypothetical protein
LDLCDPLIRSGIVWEGFGTVRRNTSECLNRIEQRSARLAGELRDASV